MEETEHLINKLVNNITSERSEILYETLGDNIHKLLDTLLKNTNVIATNVIGKAPLHNAYSEYIVYNEEVIKCNYVTGIVFGYKKNIEEELSRIPAAKGLTEKEIFVEVLRITEYVSSENTLHWIVDILPLGYKYIINNVIFSLLERAIIIDNLNNLESINKEKEITLLVDDIIKNISEIRG